MLLSNNNSKIINKDNLYVNTYKCIDCLKKNIISNYETIDNTVFRDISTREKLHDALLMKSNQSLLKNNFSDDCETNKSLCLSLIKLINNILELNKVYSIYNIHLLVDTKNMELSNNLLNIDINIYYLGLYNSYIGLLLNSCRKGIFGFIGYDFFLNILSKYMFPMSFDLYHKSILNSTYGYIQLHYYDVSPDKRINSVKYSQYIMDFLANPEITNFIKNGYKKIDNVVNDEEFIKEVGKLLISFLEEFKHNLENEECLLKSNNTDENN